MTRTNWVTLALFLSGLSGMLGAMDTWQQVLDIRFAGGVVGLGAAVINAAFGEAPAESNAASRIASNVVQKISGTGDGTV